MLYDVDAERAVISCLLQDPDAVPRHLPRLQLHHFSDARNRLLFAAIQKIAANGHVPDLITVRTELGDNKFSLDDFANIVSAATTPKNIDGYIKRVINTSRRRQMNEIATSLSETVESGQDASIDSTISSCMEMLHRVDSLNGETASDAYNIARAADHIRSSKVEVKGSPNRSEWQFSGVLVPSGIGRIDDFLYGGLEKESLMVIGAWPGTGKTAIELEMALSQCMKGMKVVIYSYEMGRNRLAMRLASRLSGVNGQRIKAGLLTPEEYRRVDDALDQLSFMDIIIVDDAPPVTSMLLADALYRQRVSGANVFYIDHIGYLQPAEPSGKENVDVRIIMNDLVKLRESVKCPVIALSQLSKGGDSPSPSKKLLYGSVFVEANADYIVILERPERGIDSDSEVLLAKFEKNRDGEEGIVRLSYVPRYGEIR